MPAGEGAEFLASSDEWCRPVNLTLGPDGGLYVVDMYRAVVERPEWVSEELKRRQDRRYGDDRGRIYRVLSEETSGSGMRPKLSKATGGELVDYLSNRNGWWRETAARLLLERRALRFANMVRCCMARYFLILPHCAMRCLTSPKMPTRESASRRLSHFRP